MKFQPTSRLLLMIILLGHFLLTFAYSTFNPLGEAPDEADHWAYIVHLARERALPVGASMTQSKHPPFYHASAAIVASLVGPSNDFLRSNPDVDLTPSPGWSPNFFIHTQREAVPWQGGVLAFHLARLWSVLLSTFTVAALYGLARRLLPQIPWLAIASTAILAFLPEFAFIGAAATNDNAAALFGTLALWGAVAHFQSGGRFRPGWWTPLALGFGLLSKSSTLALWPVVALAILWGTVEQSPNQLTWSALHQVARVWRKWLQTGLLVFVPALLIAAPWLLRNWLLYGDPLGMALVRQTIDLRTTAWTWVDSAWLLRGWFISFWGKFGGAGHIPMAGWLYYLLLLLTVCSVTGVGRLFFSRSWLATRFELLLLVTALVGTALGIWQYSLIALGTDQGRLLYPAVAAIVILWAAGILSWFPKQQMGKIALMLSIGSLVLGLYGLLGVIVPSFAPPQPLTNQAWQSAALEPVVDWQEIELVGWQLAPEPVLYWRASTPPSEDWRTILRVVATDGTLVWEWRRSPAAGRFSTDRWQVGDVIADPYTIGWPDWAGAGTYRVEVGVQALGQEPLLPSRNGTPADNPYFYLGDVTR